MCEYLKIISVRFWQKCLKQNKKKYSQKTRVVKKIDDIGQNIYQTYIIIYEIDT